MRIVVNNIAASTGGAMTILKSLYDYVVEHDKENQWIFLLNDKYFEETENIQIRSLPSVKKNWFNRLFFDMYTGKKYINKLKPDVYISLQNNLVKGLECYKIVYLHQVIPFQKEKKFKIHKKREAKLWIYQNVIGKLINKSISKADLLIVQSKWLRNIMIEKGLKEKEEILIVEPEINEVLISNIQNNKQLSQFDKKTTTFFYPANKAVYKNHDIIFEVADILNNDPEYKDRVRFKLTLNNNYQSFYENIEFLGGLSHENTLKEINNSFLLFTSCIESYGLPLLEAQLLNTPILTADFEYSRDVLKGYDKVVFFDGFNKQDLLNKIKMIVDTPYLVDNTSDKHVITNSQGWKLLLNKINEQKETIIHD